MDLEFDAGIHAIATRSARCPEQHAVLLNKAEMEACVDGECMHVILKIEDMLAPAFVIENITADDDDCSLDDIAKVLVVKPRAK